MPRSLSCFAVLLAVLCALIAPAGRSGGAAFAQVAPEAASEPADPAARVERAEPPPPTLPASPPTVAPGPLAIGAAEAARLAEVLRDEARRAALIAALEALARLAPAAMAEPGAQPPAPITSAPVAQAARAEPAPATSHAAAPAAEPPLPLAPDSLGALLLKELTTRAEAIAATTVRVLHTLADAPRALDWLGRVATDPATRGGVLRSLWQVVLLLAAGIAAERLAILALRPLRQRLLAQAPQTWWRRVPLAIADLVLDLLPVAAFALVAYSLIPVLERWPSRQLVLLVAANAYLVVRLARAAGRFVFSPDAPAIRLIPTMSDETAAYAQIWVNRITIVALAGFAAIETARTFGLDAATASGLFKALWLTITLLLVVVVLQNREAVREVLRAPEDARGAFAVIRNRVADVWHILATLYLLAAWVVTALEIEDGYGRILAFTVTTILVVAAAKLAELAINRGIERMMAIDPAVASRHAGIEARVNRYLPALKTLLGAGVWTAAGVILLQAWGFNAFSWFSPGNLGHRLLGALASIGITVLLAIVVWESVNAAIQRRLDALARDAQAARSARVRTLLPMLRTLLTGVIVVVVALITLSEIGVNIAPLLAGAGVIGLAIGFGSQRLVQDLITGVFLLMEDALAVGDVVSVSGQTGVVEGLSIRSIRLRSLDGTVHIIPFSAVTMVSNMTKDFAFAVFDIGVAYHEDTDRVVEVLKKAAEEMRAEGRWAAVIREPLEILGVDRFSDSAVVIRARFRTNAGSQWAVTREFNRRYKKAFDEAGIEIPFPYRKVVVASDDGSPPSEETKRAAAIAGAA
ncbi:MAG: mechanosensitive ion channel [Acetobacteraceae bacterium]|nr:mechanosensitive ion channel [Acetobacteraceae bacterium]